MQPILDHVRAIDAVLKKGTAADLPALADAHGRFEAVVALAGRDGTVAGDRLVTLAAQAESARRGLEALILKESEDVAAELARVARTLGDMTRLIGEASMARPATFPSAPPATSSAAASILSSPLPDPAPDSAAGQPLSPDDLALVGDFVAESAGHCDAAEQQLILLEEDADDADAVAALFRAFHTLKGVAGFLNLAPLQDLAHAAESVLDRARDRTLRVTGPVADRLLAGVDAVRRVVESVRTAAANGTPVRPTAGVAELTDQLTRDAAAAPVEEVNATPGPRHAPTHATAQAVDSAATVPPHVTCVEDAKSTARPVACESSPAPNATAPHPSAAAPAAFVKVATDRLDRLIDAVGELVVAQNMLARAVADAHVAPAAPEASAAASSRLATQAHAVGKIVRDLQAQAMAMRMVPLSSVLRTTGRLVRDLSRKTGKPVELHVTGGDVELDRHVAQGLADPLVHLIRNCVDHGIEPPDERERLGKPRAGQLRLTAAHRNGGVHIELTDDGRGLDRPRVLAKAKSAGLVAPDADPADAAIDALIFAPGLSTATHVTDLSGRGVGMDVVRRDVEKLRGRVDVRSVTGRGCGFTLRLPLTLSVIDGLAVRVAGQTYVLPVGNVERSLRPAATNVVPVAGRGELLDTPAGPIPLLRLARVLGLGVTTADPPADPSRVMAVLVADGDRRAALLVNELLGQEQVVLKTLGEGLARLPGVSGGAVLGDGRIGLVLDVAGLLASMV